MKSVNLSTWIGEQFFASGFTFFLFLAAARLMVAHDHDIFAALFSLNQSFTFFLFGLVLHPVASSTSKNTSGQLGIAMSLLVGLVLLFALTSPLMMRFFSSLSGSEGFWLWALGVTYFVSHSFFETARWIAIRLRGAQSALAISVLRFSLFCGAVLVCYLFEWRLSAVHFILTLAFFNIVAVVGYAFILRRSLVYLRPVFPDRRALRNIAALGNSFASFCTNLAVVTLIDRGLVGGLSAFQAIRSATNPLGMIGQVIDNHYSAHFARSQRAPTWSSRWFYVAIAFSIFVVGVAALWGEQIADLLFAGRYSEYWVLLPLLVVASVAHTLTRPLFVKWRIHVELAKQNRYSLLLLFLGLPLLLLTGLAGYTYAMVSVFALLPVTAVLVEKRPVGRAHFSRH